MTPIRFTLLAAIGCLFAFDACAYIDPGAGSMLVQSLLAAIAAGAVFGRSLWQRVKAWFRRGEHDRRE